MKQLTMCPILGKCQNWNSIPSLSPNEYTAPLCFYDTAANLRLTSFFGHELSLSNPQTSLFELSALC